MSESEWFVIPDLEDFTKKARSIVYSNFGSWQNEQDYEIIINELENKDQEELDNILSQQESYLIVKENVKREKNKKTQKIRYTLNNVIFAEIISKLNQRMVSNIITGLVRKGFVESAFDEKENDFVFWVKDDKKQEEEKPETD